jgi:hypothetical protein
MGVRLLWMHSLNMLCFMSGYWATRPMQQDSVISPECIPDSNLLILHGMPPRIVMIAVRLFITGTVGYPAPPQRSVLVQRELDKSGLDLSYSRKACAPRELGGESLGLRPRPRSF